MSATNGFSHGGLGDGAVETTPSGDTRRIILVSSLAIRPPATRTERPTAPSGGSAVADRPGATSGVYASSERLPRDVLVRLSALSRKVGDIRRDHAAHAELSQRLDNVAADLDALVRGIYDGSVQHLAGPRE